MANEKRETYLLTPKLISSAVDIKQIGSKYIIDKSKTESLYNEIKNDSYKIPNGVIIVLKDGNTLESVIGDGINSWTDSLKISVDIDSILDNYVEKDGDKVLSTNDFTDTYKDQLDNLDLNSGTGWAIYNDSSHTSGTPLVVNEGVRTKITNNATTIINTQLPEGVTSWWNSTTNKITPSLDGDSYLVNIRFTAISSSPTGLFDLEFDVGGSLGVIDGSTVSLRKGITESQRVSVKLDLYSGTTFLTNGGEFYIRSINGNTSIYDVRLKITRIHKAKSQ